MTSFHFDYHPHTHVCAQVSPLSGEVQAGQKEVVRLKVCAGIPDRLLETLQVELAHFDPINVQVRYKSLLTALLPDLARQGTTMHPLCTPVQRCTSVLP